MAHPVAATLTPEEQAQMLDIQDRLIHLFVDRGEALAAGNAGRVDALQDEIDDLLRERDSLKMWAAAEA